MKNSLKISLPLVLMFIAAALPAAEQLNCVMHVHSEFSGANSTPLEKLSFEAEKAGIDAVVLADKDFLRVEYGLWPLRNLLKESHCGKSVMGSCGIRAYFERVAAVQRARPRVILIPGVETAPFYFWSGSPLSKTLRLNSLQKHMLITGLENENDYLSLPVVPNPERGRFDPLALWPLLMIIPVLLFWDYRAVALLFAALGAAFLANNYPFHRPLYDQYHGDQGELPYQELIDYVSQRGGLIYWAHPEAPNNDMEEKIGPVTMLSPRYAKSLVDTRGYTGFAIFSEGYREAGSAGGYWDKALLEYCSGKRAGPAWAVGELDYGVNSFGIGDIKNVMMAESRTPRGVLKALRDGAYFVSWRGRRWELVLGEFSVSSGGQQAFCGGELIFGGPVRVRMKLWSSDGLSRRVRVQVVRNGTPIKLVEADTPADVTVEDPYIPPPGKSYYRVLIDAGYPWWIATNPVFVQR